MGDNDGNEEDYMSDAFIQQQQDIRPGLLTRSRRRLVKVADKHAKSLELPKRKKIKLAEVEARKEALLKPLSKESKGFSMLKKMGYKEGTGLGKSGEGSTSLIPLVLKDGRRGLGRSTFMEEKMTKTVENATRNLEEFRQRKQHSAVMKKIETDLRKSQLACEQLDEKLGISNPERVWFWTEESHLSQEEEASDEDDSQEDVLVEPSEKLATLTLYLRSKHFYCIWCGTTYCDGDDMEQNCPGASGDLHD